MARGGFEFIEHTADVGIHAYGATLGELFEQAASGLRALIAEDSHLEPKVTRDIALSADDAGSLLLAWLQELLFWFSSEKFLPARCILESVTPTELRGQVLGETYDPARHVQGREVKAITRHLLEVVQQDGQWHGRVLVDI